MKFYVQYLTRNKLTNHVVPLCGSEGSHALDARRSYFGLISDAEVGAWRLKDVYQIVGYQIFNGAQFGEGQIIKEGKLPFQEKYWAQKVAMDKQKALDKWEEEKLDMLVARNIDKKVTEKIHQSNIKYIKFDKALQMFRVMLKNGIERNYTGNRTVVFDAPFVSIT